MILIPINVLSLKFDHHIKDKIKIPVHKCHSGPTTTKKIHYHLAECEEEVKIHLLKGKCIYAHLCRFNRCKRLLNNN